MSNKFVGPIGKELRGNRERATQLIGPTRLMVQRALDKIEARGGKGSQLEQWRTADGCVVWAYVIKETETPIVRVLIECPEEGGVLKEGFFIRNGDSRYILSCDGSVAPTTFEFGSKWWQGEIDTVVYTVTWDNISGGVNFFSSEGNFTYQIYPHCACVRKNEEGELLLYAFNTLGTLYIYNTVQRTIQEVSVSIPYVVDSYGQYPINTAFFAPDGSKLVWFFEGWSRGNESYTNYLSAGRVFTAAVQDTGLGSWTNVGLTNDAPTYNTETASFTQNDLPYYESYLSTTLVLKNLAFQVVEDGDEEEVPIGGEPGECAPFMEIRGWRELSIKVNEIPITEYRRDFVERIPLDEAHSAPEEGVCIYLWDEVELVSEEITQKGAMLYTLGYPGGTIFTDLADYIDSVPVQSEIPATFDAAPVLTFDVNVSSLILPLGVAPIRALLLLIQEIQHSISLFAQQKKCQAIQIVCNETGSEATVQAIRDVESNAIKRVSFPITECIVPFQKIDLKAPFTILVADG